VSIATGWSAKPEHRVGAWRICETADEVITAIVCGHPTVAVQWHIDTSPIQSSGLRWPESHHDTSVTYCKCGYCGHLVAIPSEAVSDNTRWIINCSYCGCELVFGYQEVP
jgi:hypothetical protein